jgi:hypothetical protein
MYQIRPIFCLLAAVAALSLCGCTTSSQSRFGNAAATPLSDLNVVRTEIPAVLEQASKEPYAYPADRSCEALTAEVHKLDEALGPDLDVPPSASNPGLIERGGDMVESSAIGALQSTAEGIIPFRSWVRKLTGAERHSRQVAAAISAGVVRRAYLKGIGNALGCRLSVPAPVSAATTSPPPSPSSSPPSLPPSLH